MRNNRTFDPAYHRRRGRLPNNTPRLRDSRRNCEFCDRLHTRNARTCSDECEERLLVSFEIRVGLGRGK